MINMKKRTLLASYLNTVWYLGIVDGRIYICTYECVLRVFLFGDSVQNKRIHTHTHTNTKWQHRLPPKFWAQLEIPTKWFGEEWDGGEGSSTTWQAYERAAFVVGLPRVERTHTHTHTHTQRQITNNTHTHRNWKQCSGNIVREREVGGSSQRGNVAYLHGKGPHSSFYFLHSIPSLLYAWIFKFCVCVRECVRVFVGVATATGNRRMRIALNAFFVAFPAVCMCCVFW